MVLIGSARGKESRIGKYSAIRAGPAVSTAQCEANGGMSDPTDIDDVVDHLKVLK